jgi:hypothetical protein
MKRKNYLDFQFVGANRAAVAYQPSTRALRRSYNLLLKAFECLGSVSFRGQSFGEPYPGFEGSSCVWGLRNHHSSVPGVSFPARHRGTTFKNMFKQTMMVITSFERISYRFAFQNPPITAYLKAIL